MLVLLVIGVERFLLEFGIVGHWGDCGGLEGLVGSAEMVLRCLLLGCGVGGKPLVILVQVLRSLGHFHWGE